MTPSSYELGIDKDTQGAFLTRYHIKDVQQGDGGMVDTLMAIVIDYLNNNMGQIRLSDSYDRATHVQIFQYFPQNDFSIPSIILEATDVESNINFIGGIYRDDPDLRVRTVRGDIELTFDVFGRTTREKNSISGWLMNVLYRGIYDNILHQNGIRDIRFVRSVDRGYDQADRVLQFHTHSPSSELIFRQLVSFRFTFDWVITPRSDVGYSSNHFVGSISSTYSDTNDSNIVYSTSSSRQKSLYFPISFTLP